MNESSQGTVGRQALLGRLLDAVKQCQIRFGGRTELATEDDPRVSTLCTSFEIALQHGLRHQSKHRAAIKHVSEMVTAGLSLNMKANENRLVFWHFVREFLTRHEQERYSILKSVSTDLGRGRAWLRSALNEHSLERYMHMFLADTDHINHYYEDWAFLKDQESSCMLPNMAAGLSSILFAINIDNADLNQSALCQRALTGDVQTGEPDANEPGPVFANIPKETKEKKRRRRVPLQIVSFDDDNLTPNGTRLSINVALCNSAPPSCLPSPNNTSSNVSFRDLATKSPRSSMENLLSRSAQGYLCEAFVTRVKRGGDNRHLNPEENSQASNSDADCSETTDVSVSQKAQCSHDTQTARSEITLPSQPNCQSPCGLTVERKRVSDICIKDRKTPLTPINDASVGELFPMTNNEDVHSDDSVSIPSFSEDADNAAASSALTRKLISQHNAVVLNDVYKLEKATSANKVAAVKCGTADINSEDYKRVTMTVKQKKDELEEENRSLRCLLDKEMELSASLRLEREDCERKQQEKLHKLQTRLQTITRENEILKHQLKKYVGAVQMLKRDGTQAHEALATLNHDSMLNNTETRQFIDYHWEAIEYERKLVQVAEMHGELMEFNERLHRLVSQKESMVRRLREELVDLRGPLPDDNQTSDDDISITSDYDNSSMTAAVRALINIWIPSVFLTGKSSDVHHVYQIYIRIRDDEWNVYRRYAQFYALHKELKRKEQSIGTFDFPPKKVLGNKDSKFVEERRKRLQHYLRCVVNLAVQCNTELISNPDKETFVTVLPFFGELLANSGRQRNPRNSFFFPSTSSASQTQEVAAVQHYTGL